MKTYVADIIPRVQRFSKKLDSKALLMNQHWVMVDDADNSKTVYIFHAKNVLLLSRNGIVEKATWEMIDPHTVLITTDKVNYLFKHGFLDERVLAFMLDGKTEYALFVNDKAKLSTVYDVESYLSSMYLNTSQKPVDFNSVEGSGNSDDLLLATIVLIISMMAMAVFLINKS